MRGPETPTMLLKASDRMSRSRLWNVVHGEPAPPSRLNARFGTFEPEPVAEQIVVHRGPTKLGQRGTPVAMPRRARR